MIGSFAGCRVCPTAILGQKFHTFLYAVVIDSVDDFPFEPPQLLTLPLHCIKAVSRLAVPWRRSHRQGRPVSVGNRRMIDFGSEATLTDSPMRRVGFVISFDARHSIAPGCDRRVSILQLIESEP